MTTRTVEGWMRTVQEGTREALQGFFEAKHRRVRALAPAADVMVEEVESLTMRGGKRLRPLIAAAAYEACAPQAPPGPAHTLGACLELLQTALLVHDDWMDGDTVRRGGPAVHHALRGRLGEARLGDAVGVLAGDLATSMAHELLEATPFPGGRRAEAHRAFLDLLEEVYLGQCMDLCGDPDVARMHRLKTTSYTVLGPARLGALLGDGSPGAVESLTAWAIPLGEAFQIRDDLIGTFGDASETGKPGDDLRHGKRTAVVAEARASASGETLVRLDRVFGRPDASADELAAARRALVDDGVVGRVETRLEALVDDAREVLERAPLDADGKALLAALATRLNRRRA